MPWTESRTREEWLAEVRRRGERIRRRRRVALSVVGALALVLPVSALVSMTGGDPDPNLRVTAAGPGQGSTAAGALLPIVTTTSLEAEIAHVPPSGSAAAAEPGSVPSAEASPPTTAEVHRRAGAVNGRAPYDDPVVRPAPTTTLGEGGSTGNSSSSPALAAPSAPPPTTDPTLTTCPVSEVEVVVTVERSNYASGETVQWTSTLTNLSLIHI